ncbi:MAG: alpha/beta hydrolase [Candidatus Omnitrophica bacterium]|nr:alpha/beta hydrolase [Candidatus Omnitrophota bacterium]
MLVLVHGAYHGAWCWNKITGLLRAANLQVFTPTLSGLGEKKELLGPGINLSTHISDIVSFLKAENLGNVTLLGHSYSGFVVAGVAEIIPERISRIIYLDAMVPMDGQRVFDIRPGIRPRGEEIEFNGRKVKVMLPPEPGALGITDQQDASWVKPLLTPMPYACYDEPVRINNPKVNSIKKVYLLNEIQTPGESRESHQHAYDRAEGNDWSRRIIPGPHDSMITHPGQLAEILIQTFYL